MSWRALLLLLLCVIINVIFIILVIIIVVVVIIIISISISISIVILSLNPAAWPIFCSWCGTNSQQASNLTVDFVGDRQSSQGLHD